MTAESKSFKDETLEDLDDRMDERTMDGLLGGLDRLIAKREIAEVKPGSEKPSETPEN